MRFVNGQRGRVCIFKIDDGTETLEAVASEATFEAARDVLKDDELVIIQGKVQPDRFSGGLRLNVKEIWGLPAARARFGRHLALSLEGDADIDVQPLLELVRTWPAQVEQTEEGELVRGLGLRMRIRRDTACAELDLGEAGRFWPSDEALARCKALAGDGGAEIAYEASA
jgi:DNA polymerase-3 subunit alpha